MGLRTVAGDDRLVAGSGYGVVTPGPGDDEVDGNTGEDTIAYAQDSTGLHVDLKGGTATSSEGTDTLRRIENVEDTTSADTIIGDDGSNDLSGYSGTDSIHGRRGNDSLSSGGDAVLSGGRGDDLIYGDGDVFGGRGDDHLLASGASDAATLNGGKGADRLKGTQYADQLDGGAGADLVIGGSGDDSILGRDGDDLLRGRKGTDTIDGGADVDRCGGETLSNCEREL